MHIKQGGISLRMGNHRFADAMVELRCADSTLLDFCRLIDPTRKGRLLVHCNDNRHINVIRTTLV